jgi:probable rRNA maturation factor
MSRSRARQAPTAPAVDVVVDSVLWKGERGVDAMLRRAVAEAAALASEASGQRGNSKVRAPDTRHDGSAAHAALASEASGQRGNSKVASTTGGELAILLTDDSAIRALNRDWRGKDEPTNVLSFPAQEACADGRAPRMLGDIVIAYETAAREAEVEGKPLVHHLAHLAVHGFLHLVGYDHEASEEADAMERLEVAILARLGVPDPYPMRDA